MIKFLKRLFNRGGCPHKLHEWRFKDEGEFIVVLTKCVKCHAIIGNRGIYD